MSTIKQLPSGNFQLRVTNKLLPTDFYSTFTSREEAQAYGDRLEALLKQGVVPAALLEKKVTPTSWMVSRCIAEYVKAGEPQGSDIKVLETVMPTMVHESTAGLTYQWCEDWLNRLKRENNLAPSTIRHRVGALKRCFDWMLRKHPDILAYNHLSQFKVGYATYTAEDERILALKGKQKKEDIERDRRLGENKDDEDEEQLVLAAMKDMPHERTFFNLALETAMRMREMYTLDVSQISLPKRTIHLTRTKNGDNRQVPMSSVAIPLMRDYLHTYAADIKARNGVAFPYWNGVRDEKNMASTTSQTSRIFHEVFEAAKLEDFVFHDLRHEATCRLFLRTKFSDILIAKVTGHKDLRMLKRYASLRGSDMADGMW
ncbi:site-specific integrase [Collimonas antrihumi]|uniref:site-specific integrase n=1 Tax=Collimonas antrihumi TaxID=1940615 RepID=UPI001B8BE37F|nr:site-specific integrase [Collimonas antrihumi]